MNGTFMPFDCRSGGVDALGRSARSSKAAQLSQ